jgi:hypothetical protein
MNQHPGWENSDRMQNEYHNICKELYKKIEDDERANKKIIKAFIKEVHLSKNSLTNGEPNDLKQQVEP